jgi:hypothetical protein
MIDSKLIQKYSFDLILYIFHAGILYTSGFIYHQLLRFIYATSNMFRLSYPPIIRELVLVDNTQLVANHRMVIIHMLQFVYYICGFKIIQQYVRKIFKDKIYKKYKM